MGMMIFPTLLLSIIEPGAMGTINRIKAKSRNELSLKEVLHALADPVRLEIVRQLDEAGKKACGMFGIDMPKSSLSHHFRILRKSGVIVSETQGTIIMNRLRRKDLEARFPGVLKSILAATRQEDRVIQHRG
jgi:DNA-binding transcriptional ArsR family regulator